jgi:hypothetical protein
VQSAVKSSQGVRRYSLRAHFYKEGDAKLASPEQMAALTEQAAFFRTNRRGRPAKPLAPVKIQTYVIDYRVLDPKLVAAVSRPGRQPAIEFAVAAFDGDGRAQNGVVNDAASEASTPAAGNKAGLYRVRQTITVPINPVSIRVGVRDRSSDRIGTLEVPLPLKPEPANQASAVR